MWPGRSSPWARQSQMYHSDGPAGNDINLKLGWGLSQKVMTANQKE